MTEAITLIVGTRMRPVYELIEEDERAGRAGDIRRGQRG